MQYIETLENGLRIVGEEIPHLRSVSVGLWVGTGSCYEEESISGVSHYLEHMMFKGTEKRSARELAEVMDSVGGQINAFTSKEHTCYYTKSLDEDFELAIDVLSDMFLTATFAEKEFDREKGVILEEINMYEDTPDDVASEQFCATLWPTHVFGRPIIGSTETVKNLTRDDLISYYKAKYQPQQTVLAVAGNVSKEKVIATVEKYLGAFNGEKIDKSLPPAKTAAGNAYTHKDIEQAHICFGGPGISGNDDKLYIARTLSNILGGGMSSRLFQEAREKRGLTYGIYAYNMAFTTAGSFLAMASTSPKNTDEVIEVMAQEMQKIIDESLDKGELERNKQQMKGQMMLGLENSGNVMLRLGRNMINYNRIIPVEEVTEKVMAVSEEQIKDLAQKFFNPDHMVLSIVGPEDTKLDWKKYFN